MAKEYNFQYTPLTGRLPGNSFVKQTEQAINELAGIVNEGSAQVEVITNLANTANDNSEEALEKANEALSTASRVYITLPNLSDADDYYNSELYYFANSYSANLPVQDTGFLDVKTNDTKTACEQVFIADLTGLCYFRHGTITSAEVGSETVYTVTWSTWSSELASEDYVQQEVNTGVGAANGYTDNKVSNYLPLSGGTLTGAINTANNTWNKLGDDASFGDHNVGGKMCIKTQTSTNTGIAFFNSSDTNVGQVEVNNEFNFNKTIKQSGTAVSLSGHTHSYLPLSGGTLTGTVNGVTPTAGDNSTKLATTAFVKTAVDVAVPTGVVQAFAGTTIPNGWLLCDGSAVSRTTYANLFSVIGTTYGSGNGSTTFNVPNLIDKFVEGSATAGTVKQPGLPNITGEWRDDESRVMQDFRGAFHSKSVTGSEGNFTSAGTYTRDLQHCFDASLSNPIYGASNTVQPPALTMKYIIKY